jgi:hypothetical protein
MDRTGNRAVVLEVSFGVLLWLSQVGLPVLDIQQEFWFGLCVWSLFLAISVHLGWTLLPRKLRAAGKAPLVLLLALAIAGPIYPGLKRRYRQEHPRIVAAPPLPAAPSPAPHGAQAVIAEKVAGEPPPAPPVANQSLPKVQPKIEPRKRHVAAPPESPAEHPHSVLSVPPSTAPFVPPISQNMNNSPGGVQVGGSLIVNPQPLQRIITETQYRTIVTALRKSGPQEFGIRHSEGNAEAQKFADMFVQTLQDAGWKARMTRFLIMTHEGFGLFVMVKDWTHPPEGAVALVTALTAAGLSPNKIDAPIEDGTFDLYVGLVPEAPR